MDPLLPKNPKESIGYVHSQYQFDLLKRMSYKDIVKSVFYVIREHNGPTEKKA